jgi:hypothetical protein
MYQKKCSFNGVKHVQIPMGYCGYGADYCGTGCKAGPCTNSVSGTTDSGVNNGDGDIINDQKFACAFNTIKAPPPSKTFFGLGTCKWLEIFRICWGCIGEAVLKISALYHDV